MTPVQPTLKEMILKLADTLERLSEVLDRGDPISVARVAGELEGTSEAIRTWPSYYDLP